jgi:hypothetical protein
MAGVPGQAISFQEELNKLNALLSARPQSVLIKKPEPQKKHYNSLKQLPGKTPDS